jgi:predicted  nucleic acid-binding Zn-ribbon protein
MALLWLLQPLADQLDRIEKSLAALHKKADHTMTAVQVQQEALDEYAQAVSDVAEEIGSDIEALKKAVEDAGVPLPQANVDSLSASLDKLKGLDQPDVEPLPEP